MLPTKKPQAPSYRTLDEIRLRKDELLDDIQKDNEQFSALWSQVFVKQKDSSKGEYIASLVGHGITAFDTFLLVRKLLKNYRNLFGKKKR